MTDTILRREISALVAGKRDEIAALCREYSVAKLGVFGSKMTDEFDFERSDIDFIVTLVPESGLTRLFKRNVDVIDARARGFENRHVAKTVDRTRSVVFDGHQSEVRSSAA